ncbi:DUF2730 family protein [Actinobacillus delphinicola]|uniref:Protein of uncharacterized function (DUF2730) n=1 Tax=Actinobacillus delphinicola TaxID=51161 RepID=A0A448TUX9_9PAST|nr:DUF2730 family protein [Actinobacillus delphinicola]VEJ09734.1 Protein of uncharacterised function (DUF2730) [Actinobacillus delphinicola]
MSEILMWLKEYWGFLVGIITVVSPFVWLKLDARYAKKNDLHELRQSLLRIEKTMTTLEVHIQKSQEILNMLMKKELNK